MANGDMFDPDPLGTTTPSPTLQPNDPLIDWGSNLKPSDLQRFIHDPEGAKQSLIDQGVAPPEHHYDSNGNPVSGDQAAAMDAAKAQLTRSLQQMQGVGSVPTPPPQPVQQAPIRTGPRGIEGNVSDYAKPLGFTSSGEGGYDPGTEAQANEPKKPWFPPSSVDPAGRPTFPSPIAKRLHEAFDPPDPASEPPVTPLPAPRPTEAPAPTVAPAPPKEPPVPTPEPKPEKPGKKKIKAEDDEEENKYDKALSGFSKSLAGVKVPQRPPLPSPGLPSVRSPVGINPSLGALLTAAGAHAPQTTPPILRMIRGY